MAITAYEVESRSFLGDDFSYVSIAVTWKGKDYLERPTECEKTKVMWSHDSIYGVVGSKVGDFIECYGQGANDQEGVFTHRHIAENLVNTFSGLKINELEWLENPLEKVLVSGKPRVKKARWLPDRDVDLVHLYSDVYVDVYNPVSVESDFFNVIRWDIVKHGKKWLCTWFMCNESTSKKLKKMGFKNLRVKKATIHEQQLN
jgi:hypothetical protein